MVLVDLGEGVCVICLVFRVFFEKRMCTVPQMNFKSFFRSKKKLAGGRGFGDEACGVGGVVEDADTLGVAPRLVELLDAQRESLDDQVGPVVVDPAGMPTNSGHDVLFGSPPAISRSQISFLMHARLIWIVFISIRNAS
jgi:hypothetical protein